MKKLLALALATGLVLSGQLALAKGKKPDAGDDTEVQVLHNDDMTMYIPLKALHGHLRAGDCIDEPRDSSHLDAIEKAGLTVAEAYCDGGQPQE